MSILYYLNHAWHPHMQSWNPYDFKVENDIGPWCWFVNAEGGKLNQEWVSNIRAFGKSTWEFTTLQTNIYIYYIIYKYYIYNIIVYILYIRYTRRQREGGERKTKREKRREVLHAWSNGSQNSSAWCAPSKELLVSVLQRHIKQWRLLLHVLPLFTCSAKTLSIKATCGVYLTKLAYNIQAKSITEGSMAMKLEETSESRRY